MSSLLDHLRLQLFPAQPEERPRLALGILTYFCIISGVVLGRNARDSLFLSSGLDVRVWLPWMYVVNAVAAVGCSAVYAAFVDRVDRRWFASAITALFLAALLVGRALLAAPAAWVFVAVYALAQVIWLFSVMQFWTFAGDLFDTRQARRVFPAINAGGLAGMVAAGFLGKPLVSWVGTEGLLLVWAGLLGCSLALLLLMRRGGPPAVRRRAGRERERADSLFGEGASALRGIPLVRLLAGITLAQWVVFTLVDYAFSQTAHAALPGRDDLTVFLGLFRGTAGGAALLLQVFIVPPLIRGLGMGWTVLFHPLLLIPATFFASAEAGLWPSAVCKFGDHALLYTVQESSYQLLYYPLPMHRRGRIRAFVEGALKPVSMGLAGLILVGFTRLFEGLSPLYSAAFGLSILWLLVAARVGPAYVSGLVAGLRSPDGADRAAAARSARTLDARDMVKVLAEGVRNPDAHVAVFSLELLQQAESPDRRALVAEALARPEAEVRAEALYALGEIAPEDALPILEGALSDPAPGVRAAAAAAMGKLEDERTYAALERAVDDPDAGVQEAALVAMTRSGGLDGVLMVAERLKGMLSAPAPDRRRAAARVLGALRARSMSLPLQRLLKDGRPEVRAAAVEALGRVHDVRSADDLVRAMAERPLRRKARKAVEALLRRQPERVVPVLRAAADDPGLRPIWPDLLELLGDTGGAPASPEVERLFLARLGDEDSRVRRSALKGLGGPAAREAGLRERIVGPLRAHAHRLLERLQRDRRIVEDLRTHFREGPEDLEDLLRDAVRRVQGELFRVLGLLSDPGLMRTVAHRIADGDSRQRADALEALEGIGLEAIVRPLLASLDGGPGGTAPDGARPLTPSPAALARMLAAHPSATVRAAAVRWLCLHRPDLARATLPALRDDPDRMVLEAVRCAAHALTSPEERPMISTIEKILYLKTIPMFARLDAAQLRLLAEVVAEEARPALDAVFEQNDAPDALYMIVNGSVRLTRKANGQTRTLGVQGPRTYFGEMGFIDGQPRSDSVIATEPTLLLTLSHEAFKEAIQEEPEIALSVLGEITRLLRQARTGEGGVISGTAQAEGVSALLSA